MDVRSCRNCGKLFNYLQGPPICPACRKRLETKFSEVKEYIREHEESSIREISEENDVSVKQLKQWIRDERLSFSKNSPVGIECEVCGAMIRTGRFCEKCKNNMATNLKHMYEMPPMEVEKTKGHEKDKMRYLDK